MSGMHFRPWEPEESIGALWHALVGKPDARPNYPEASVSLAAMRVRMCVVLRGLGGAQSIAIEVAAPQRVQSRRSFRQRLGHADELYVFPRCSADRLDVPAAVAFFSDRSLNEALYLWWAAWGSIPSVEPVPCEDPLHRDLHRLARSLARVQQLITIAPGLAPAYRVMCASLLPERRVNGRGSDEEVVERLVRRGLGDTSSLDDAGAELWDAIGRGRLHAIPHRAAAGYHPYAPVMLWPDWQDTGTSTGRADETEAGTGPGAPKENAPRRRARRQAADQVKRPDPFILNRFETIKTWAELLNIGRRAEDDETGMARKAAEDQEELGLADHAMKTASRLSFDLDLSPQDVECEQLSTGMCYPEWDSRAGVYLPDHVRVLERADEILHEDAGGNISASELRRIARVRRQFEALRPRTMLSAGEEEGSELDTEQAVRFTCDIKAGGLGNERLFRKLSGQARDLAVATLIDVSRSTESAVGERQVIAIAREALLALGLGLEATGDRQAIFAFSSLRRDRVFVSRLKDFAGRMDADVMRRIGALKPGHYTRLGAAIRHVAARLAQQGGTRRLLLVITDGKPNDIDYYEGRYGIEDTRRAVLEARMAGHAVFAITIDRAAESYVPHIFGRNGFAIVSDPEHLMNALPGIYRHLVS